MPETYGTKNLMYGRVGTGGHRYAGGKMVEVNDTSTKRTRKLVNLSILVLFLRVNTSI